MLMLNGELIESAVNDDILWECCFVLAQLVSSISGNSDSTVSHWVHNIGVTSNSVMTNHVSRLVWVIADLDHFFTMSTGIQEGRLRGSGTDDSVSIT
jgi:hypothetical protein